MASPMLAIVGPTGVGKSAAALSVAEELGAEIVAVDAFTVYRGMDVGTAKPTAEQRAAVPHHLIDVLDPSEECTVQWFQRVARAAIAEVRGRGATPLLVGGSGLYFRAVVDPLEFPPTDPEIRTAIEQRYATDPQAAHAALTDADPAAAARIDPRNLRRSVRALEVLALTGRPFSEWRRGWDGYAAIYPGLRVAGLTLARPELSQRIASRVDDMLRTGLLDECRALRARPLSDTARQAIGYAEVLDHLAGRCDLAEAAERMTVRTRHYAARQQRWFDSDPRVRWTSQPARIIEVFQSACSS